jgi:signal recognition particle GTPase
MTTELYLLQEHDVNNETFFDAGNDIEEQDDRIINVADLNSLREKIESMPKFNQIEVLRILSKDGKITLNENKYGVLVNMTDFGDDVIGKLKNYISYVNTQESNLNEIEVQKENFKNIYFVKDNKDNNGKNNKNSKYASSS